MHVSIPFHSISMCIKLSFLKIDQTAVIFFLIKLSKKSLKIPKNLEFGYKHIYTDLPQKLANFVFLIFILCSRGGMYTTCSNSCLFIFFRIYHCLLVAMIFCLFVSESVLFSILVTNNEGSKDKSIKSLTNF